MRHILFNFWRFVCKTYLDSIWRWLYCYHDGSLKAYCWTLNFSQSRRNFPCQFSQKLFSKFRFKKKYSKRESLSHIDALTTWIWDLWLVLSPPNYVKDSIYFIKFWSWTEEKCLSHDRGTWQWEFWEWVIKIRGLLFIVHAIMWTMN